jgi:transposase
MMEKLAKNFVGVDVSKKTLDVYIHPAGKYLRVKNTTADIKKLVLQLSSFDIEQIVFESSGGYEYLLAKMVSEAGHKVWRVDPKRIKAFIASDGIKYKTDKVDARMIALFAAQKRCAYTAYQRCQHEEKLQALSKRRGALMSIVTAEELRLQNPQEIYNKKSIKDHIAFLRKEIAKIDTEMHEIIKQSAKLQQKFRIIESVPGVGKTIAAALIAHVPELGDLDRKQIASLLGLAPYVRESGLHRGLARTSAGRLLPRQMLYMAALASIRFNQKIQQFYNKLCAAGKKPMVALVAVMRKLIVIINAMVRDGKEWAS